MSGFSRFLGFLTVVVSSCAIVQAGPTAEKAEPAGYRLTVELKDGSRLVGKSREERLEFRSESLGALNLSLDKVRSVEGLKMNEARLVTASGDSVVAQFVMKNLRLETTFGDVKVPVEQIKSVRVSTIGGPGRPTDGLIGFWSGDGNTDDSVSGNNGRNEHATYVEGVAGKAFSFSPNSIPWGVNSRIALMDKPEYAPTHSFTVDAWVRPRGDGNVIFTRGGRRVGTVSYSLSMDRSQTLVWEINSEKGENAGVRTQIPYCQWTHVAASMDIETGMMRIYTNGLLAVEKKTELRPISNLPPEVTPGVGIGNVNDGFNNFPFVGDICEVALYDRVLLDKEVRSIYMQHAATADGRAELLPKRANPSFGFQDQSRDK